MSAPSLAGGAGGRSWVADLLPPEPAAPPGAAVLGAVHESIERLPAQQPVAMKLVSMIDDDRTSTKDVARVLTLDPSLTAKILRLANSAFYGLSGRVGDVKFAITVVGFSAVHSIAIASAAGLTSAEPLPPGFWLRSAGAALAGSELAPRLRVAPPDAFCLGLLSGLGQALLWRADPTYAGLYAAADDRQALWEAERQRYGCDHVRITARALRAWSFPEHLPSALDAAVGFAPALPLASSMRVALEVAARAVVKGHVPTPIEHLSAGRLREEELPPVVRRVAVGAADLVRAVAGETSVAA